MAGNAKTSRREQSTDLLAYAATLRTRIVSRCTIIDQGIPR